MLEQDVDEEKLLEGEYCRKYRSGCFCAVGWPYERQCVRCRDSRPNDGYPDWCYNGGCCWTSKELEAVRRDP